MCSTLVDYLNKKKCGMLVLIIVTYLVIYNFYHKWVHNALSHFDIKMEKINE